jgi:amino acid transporter
VIVLFVITDKEPVLNMFLWFSALAVLAIIFVEILVSAAVIAFFRRDSSDSRMWNTMIAPAIAIVGLACGMYLLMSRFGLLAGTTAAGVDPTTQAWGLSTLGWFLVALPFLSFVGGAAVGAIRRRSENDSAVADLVS